MPVVTSARVGLVPLNRRRRAGEVANARGKDRNTDEDQDAGDDGADPVGQAGPRNRERQGQQVIQDEAEQKSGEKEERRSRNDARGSGVVHLLLSRVHTHVCSCGCWRLRIHPNDNQGVILEIDNQGVNWRNWRSKGNGSDGVGTTKDRGAPKDGGGPNRRQQGRGDRGADARSGPVLLQDTGASARRQGSSPVGAAVRSASCEASRCLVR